MYLSHFALERTDTKLLCWKDSGPHLMPPQEHPKPSFCEGIFYQSLETGAPVKIKIPDRSEEHEPNKRSEFRLCNNNWHPSITKLGFLTHGLEGTMSKQRKSLIPYPAFPIRYSTRLSTQQSCCCVFYPMTINCPERVLQCLRLL